MTTEQTKEIIKSIITRDLEAGEWFDVDTIGEELEEKYNIDADTTEMYELICKCIDETTEAEAQE